MLLKSLKYFLIFLFSIIHLAIYGQEAKAYDDYISISNDRSYVIDVINNDQYKGAVSLKIISYTSNGQPVFAPKVDGINLKVQYKKTGTNVIEYELCNKDPQTSCSRAFLYINTTNDDISAATDIYWVNDLEEQKYKVLDNDYYSGTISLKITQSSVFGNAKVSNKTILYQPDNLSFIKDSIQYTIQDSNNKKSTTFVYIYNTDPPAVVNSPPDISDINLSIDEDEIVFFNLSQFTNVFSDNENDPLTKIKILNVAEKGELFFQNQIIKNGDEFSSNQIKDIKYVPNTNFNGTDEIKWHAADLHDFANAPAKILLVIKPVNDAPIAINDSYTIAEGEVAYFTVMDNDYDPEMDPLILTKADMNSSFGKASIVGNQIKVIPAANFNGPANLSYTISDGSLTASANVTINITPVFEKPQAKVFSIEMNEDEAYNFSTKDFSDHFEDPDGQDLTHITFTSLPGKGALLLNNQPVSINYKIKLSEIEQLIYQPNRNYYGNDQLKYAAFDANHRSDPANISIKIIAINDLPQAMDDKGYQVNEDE